MADIFTITPRLRVPMSVDDYEGLWTLECAIRKVVHVSHWDAALQCHHFRQLDLNLFPQLEHVHPLLHAIRCITQPDGRVKVTVENRFAGVTYPTDSTDFVAFWLQAIQDYYLDTVNFRASLLSDSPSITHLQRILNERRSHVSTAADDSVPSRSKRSRFGERIPVSTATSDVHEEFDDDMNVVSSPTDSIESVSRLSSEEIIAAAHWTRDLLTTAIKAAFDEWQQLNVDNDFNAINIPALVCKHISAVIAQYKTSTNDAAVILCNDLNCYAGWNLDLLILLINKTPAWLSDMPAAKDPAALYNFLSIIDLPWLTEAKFILRWVLELAPDPALFTNGAFEREFFAAALQDEYDYAPTSRANKDLAGTLTRRICSIAPSPNWPRAAQWKRIVQILHSMYNQIRNQDRINERAALFRREARLRTETITRAATSLCNDSLICYLGQTVADIIPSHPSDLFVCVAATDRGLIHICDVDDDNNFAAPEAVKNVWYINRVHFTDWVAITRWLNQRNQTFFLVPWQYIITTGDIVQQSCAIARQIVQYWQYIVKSNQNQRGIICLPRAFMIQGLGYISKQFGEEMISQIWQPTWDNLLNQGLCPGLEVTTPAHLQTTLSGIDASLFFANGSPLIIPHAECLSCHEWQILMRHLPEHTPLYLLFTPLLGGRRFTANPYIGAGECSSVSLLLNTPLPVYSTTNINPRLVEIQRDAILLAQLQALVAFTDGGDNDTTTTAAAAASTTTTSNATFTITANELLTTPIVHHSGNSPTTYYTPKDSMRQLLDVCQTRLLLVLPPNVGVLPLLQTTDIDAFLLRSTPTNYCNHLRNLYVAHSAAMVFSDAHVIAQLMALGYRLNHAQASKPTHLIELSQTLHPLQLSILLCQFDPCTFVSSGQNWEDYANYWMQNAFRYTGMGACLPVMRGRQPVL